MKVVRLCPEKAGYAQHLIVRVYCHPIRRYFRKTWYIKCLKCDLKVEETIPGRGRWVAYEQLRIIDPNFFSLDKFLAKPAPKPVKSRYSPAEILAKFLR